eukprot:6181256-Pleurochrysis_carterae.AAC.2
MSVQSRVPCKPCSCVFLSGCTCHTYELNLRPEQAADQLALAVSSRAALATVLGVCPAARPPMACKRSQMACKLPPRGYP